VVIAGATGGAGNPACAFFCANGVAVADLSAPPDALIGARAPGLPVLSDALFSAVASRLPTLFGAVATGLSPIRLSEDVPPMLKF